MIKRLQTDVYHDTYSTTMFPSDKVRCLLIANKSVESIFYGTSISLRKFKSAYRRMKNVSNDLLDKKLQKTAKLTNTILIYSNSCSETSMGTTSLEELGAATKTFCHENCNVVISENITFETISVANVSQI